jgi:hypothetical protein
MRVIVKTEVDQHLFMMIRGTGHDVKQANWNYRVGQRFPVSRDKSNFQEQPLVIKRTAAIFEKNNIFVNAVPRSANLLAGYQRFFTPTEMKIGNCSTFLRSE